MKYPILGAALSLLLGATAFAADTQGQDSNDMSQSSSTTTTKKTTIKKTHTVSNEPGAQPQEVSNLDVFFNTASAELSPNGKANLKELADWAMCDPGNGIILGGHADPRGTKAYNLKLSGQRAATVRQALIDMGVPSERIVVTVFGENAPSGSYRKDRRVSVRETQGPVRAAELITTQPLRG